MKKLYEIWYRQAPNPHRLVKGIRAAISPRHAAYELKQINSKRPITIVGVKAVS